MNRWQRLSSAWQPIALAALAAALAWLIAHRVLGHSAPFFAPIAAAIALSTSRIQRSRRTVQMVAGVLLGIGIGEVLAATIGTSTTALAVVVFVTMSAAVLSGIGFVGQGMMFANQAAASAILVVTLHRHGTGSERAVDAFVGGAVAFVLGVVLFPAEPLSMLWSAERSVLRTLAAALREAARGPGGKLADERWPLTVSHELADRLAELARTRSTARANVRVAPRRWRLRAAVDAENERTVKLNLLANAVLGLVRARSAEAEPLPDELDQQIAVLGNGIDRLANGEQPWPPALRDEVAAIAESVGDYVERTPDNGARITTAILGATAADLSQLLVRPSPLPHTAPLHATVKSSEPWSELSRSVRRP